MTTSSDKQVVFYEGEYYIVTLPPRRQRNVSNRATTICKDPSLDEFIKPEAPKESKQKKNHRQPGVNRNIHPSLKRGGREWH